MIDVVGKKVVDAVEALEKCGKKVVVVHYNDRKMINFDTQLVIKCEENGDEITLISGNFLFRPIDKKN